MSAVLRVWWTFYTAFPLQRWLAVAAVAGVFSPGDAPFYPLGAIFFAVLAVFPAVFAAGAVLRALSAPRNHQLWPRFRVRMLIAVALFVTTIALLPAALVMLAAFADGRPLPAAVLVYPFGFVTVAYRWTYLFSGDWRFGLLFPVGLFAAVALLRVSFGPAGANATPVLSLVAAAALLAWVAFVVGYLSVRRVGQWMLTAARGPRWETPSNRPVSARSRSKRCSRAECRPRWFGNC